jgi:hypothetical protein
MADKPQLNVAARAKPTPGLQKIMNTFANRLGAGAQKDARQLGPGGGLRDHRRRSQWNDLDAVWGHSYSDERLPGEVAVNEN